MKKRNLLFQQFKNNISKIQNSYFGDFFHKITKGFIIVREKK